MKLKLKKIKITLLLVCTFGLETISLAQSKYGFETGFDSTAFVNKVFTSTAFEICVDSLGNNDTLFAKVQSYNQEGFLLELKEIFYQDNKPQKPKPFYERRIEFSYNDKGYLTDENYRWFGPVGTYGEDTVLKVKSEIWKLVNDSKILDQEIENWVYSSRYYLDSCQNYYFPDGRIDKIICKSYDIYAEEEDIITERMTFFTYNESPLLTEKRVHYNGILRRKTVYVYTFFE
jgi:hypothetical protein